MESESKPRAIVDRSQVFLKHNKLLALEALFLAIIADILFITGASDFYFFGSVGVYIAAIRFYKLTSKLTFIWCLVLLGLMYIKFLFTGPSASTEKAAVYLVLFWVVGIFQQWRE